MLISFKVEGGKEHASRFSKRHSMFAISCKIKWNEIFFSQVSCSFHNVHASTKELTFYMMNIIVLKQRISSRRSSNGVQKAERMNMSDD